MVKEEKEENNVWTIDELVALTDDVQHGTVEYKGKDFKYQYCELTESEEPKFGKVTDKMSEEDKFELYAKLGGKRVLNMILKANDKNPEGTTINERGPTHTKRVQIHRPGTPPTSDFSSFGTLFI